MKMELELEPHSHIGALHVSLLTYNLVLVCVTNVMNNTLHFSILCTFLFVFSKLHFSISTLTSSAENMYKNERKK